MPRYTIRRESAVVRSPRVMQVEGLFDLPLEERRGQGWEFDFDLPAEWNIGLIVGPSGSGKTTVARELFGDRLVGGWSWSSENSLLDSFPTGMSIKEITLLLSSVGFSSPPGWLKPFGVLSNGEQFRVHVARTLAELSDIAVIDEFTSVVDRTVAQVGSAAVARTVRRLNRKLVAVSCHYDIIDWLSPDWVFQPEIGRLERRSLRRRPSIEVVVRRVHSSAWACFRKHHYLSGALHPGSACFVALVNRRPAAFVAVLPFPHPTHSGFREHRCVCLPDFQGVGLGHAVSEFVAGMYVAAGKRYTSTTSHPAMIRHRQRSSHWQELRAPKLATRSGFQRLVQKAGAAVQAGTRDESQRYVPRITASYRYIGPTHTAAAKSLRVIR